MVTNHAYKLVTVEKLGLGQYEKLGLGPMLRNSSISVSLEGTQTSGLIYLFIYFFFWRAKNVL